MNKRAVWIMGGLYIFTGTEEFSIKERACEFVRSLFGDIPEEDESLEIIRGDSEELKSAAILDKFLAAIETPPFLTPSKMVWLKHFNKFEEALSEESSKKKKSRLDLFSDYIKGGIPEDMTILIDGPGLDRRKAFYKLCEKECPASGGALEWFDKIDMKGKGAAALLSRKIREMAMKEGWTMEEGAADFLTETVGADIPRLKNEIGKLISYSGDTKRITLSDCREICSRSQETLAWEFSSALAEKNASYAISLIPGIVETMEQEKASASAELAILAAANNEFQRILAAKCEGERYGIPSHANYNYFQSLFESRKKEDGPASPFFQIHPFRAFKAWQNASNFTGAELADAFQAIFQASRGMVTGADPRLALEGLVMKIAGKNRKV